MKNEVKNCLTWLANTLAVMYVGKQINEVKIKQALDKFYQAFKKENLINFNDLTTEEARELRFCKWQENDNLYLIPIWLYPLIPVGLELTSISGEKIVFDGNNIGDDIRFDCIAYGIELEDTEKEKSIEVKGMEVEK